MTGRAEGAGRIVVLRALGLGDLLTGVPAYRALRRAFPEREITLAAPAALAPLAGLTGAIDRVLPAAGLGPLRWPRPTPELAVNLHGRGPRSHRRLLALRPRRLLAFAHAEADVVDGPRWRADEHEVRRWCRLLAAYDIPADPADLVLPPPPTQGLLAGDPPVVIHPGAASGSRRWPAERFAAVAAALRADGWRVVVTGGAVEVPLAATVARLAGLSPESVLAGRTDLTGLAALVASAALVISGDTGVAHLATAFRRRSVVLFGPISPALWGPPARPEHVALWRPADSADAARPGDPHAAHPDPRLLRLTPADVLTPARALLAG